MSGPVSSVVVVGPSATASRRRPVLARRSIFLVSMPWALSSSGRPWEPSRHLSQRESTTSGAPFTSMSCPRSLVPMVAWKPRDGSKGSSRSSAHAGAPRAFSTPHHSAASTTARSVISSTAPPTRGGVARRAAAMMVRSWLVRRVRGELRRPSQTEVSLICPPVSVPVLSVHSTSTRARASSAWGLRTSTPLPDRRRAAATWAMVATIGKPSGMAATARLTALPRVSDNAWPRRAPRPATPDPPSTAKGTETIVNFLSRSSTPPATLAPSVTSPAVASVSSPTATTTPRASPATTDVSA